MSTFFERKRRRDVSRRAFLGGAAGLAGTAGLFYPQQALAAPLERKFLFLFAGGGWDTTTVLDPHFENPDRVSMDPNTVMGQAHGLQYTSGPDRLEVDRFFTRWGPYASIINGIDAHSVGHDSGTRFMMTGTSASSYADWPTLLAANSAIEYPLPHVVFSGPSFGGTSASAVVRAGGGTLLSLIDGSINGRSDAPAPVFDEPADDVIDTFVYNRVSDFASQQKGLARRRADGLVSNLERGIELEARQFEAGLDDLGNNLLDNMVKATEMFRLGLARTAMIRIPGGYDSHGNNAVQAPAQSNFYAAMNEVFEHLASTPGHTANWLINEVVVVAMSEFGRTPRLNGGGGKDHWPYNSMLVAGAGVNGGQMLGRTDEGLIALPVDLKTGQPSESGLFLGCEHVGLALLKIGGLEPRQFLPGVEVLDGLVRGAV